ncbi:hypothetical protein ACLKA6_002229 [Drosophila palustris]
MGCSSFCLTLLSLYIAIINCQQQSAEITQNVVLIKPVESFSYQEPAAIVFGNPPRHKFGRRKMFVHNVKKDEKKDEKDKPKRRTRRRKHKHFRNYTDKATTSKNFKQIF